MHRHAGWATIFSEDRSQSVRVFYVLRSSDVSIGSERYPVSMPPELVVEEIDYRDRSKPSWLSGEITLECDDGLSYRLAGDRPGNAAAKLNA